MVPRTTDALRFNPLSFARFIGDPLNAVRKSSSLIARISRDNVRASFPAIAARGANAGSLSARENRTFHGHTLWEVWRLDHFEIQLETGARTLADRRRKSL